MAVTTNVHSKVEACVWARSTTWVANELLRVIQEVVNLRGLPMDYMHRQHETILNGFRTWITGRWLKSTTLEVWDGATDRLVERYDLNLSYHGKGSAGGERFETSVEALRSQLSAKQRLHGDFRYRVLVDLEDGAPSLPGWEKSKLRDAGHLRRNDAGGVIGTARIGVQMEYWT